MKWQGAGKEEMSGSGICILHFKEGLTPDIWLQPTPSAELLTVQTGTAEKGRLGVRSPGHDRGDLAPLPSICCL